MITNIIVDNREVYLVISRLSNLLSGDRVFPGLNQTFTWHVFAIVLETLILSTDNGVRWRTCRPKMNPGYYVLLVMHINRTCAWLSLCLQMPNHLAVPGYRQAQFTNPNGVLNPLWPSDAIWRHISRQTLVQVMACCLTASSHHLNQCCFINSQWSLLTF